MMKSIFPICMVVILILIGCDSNSIEESPAEALKGSANVQEDSKSSNSNNIEDISKEEPDSISSEPTTSEEINMNEDQGKKTLTQFTNEEIEYARIWLQLGPNQQIDELNVKHIPAGTALNPEDFTSASYPENVIQLAGSRLVDGSVTYSGNGNGTINVYNVPLRWDGIYPAGEQFYIDIIQNTKLMYVDPNDEEKVIRLIKLLKNE